MTEILLAHPEKGLKILNLGRIPPAPFLEVPVSRKPQDRWPSQFTQDRRPAPFTIELDRYRRVGRTEDPAVFEWVETIRA